MLWVFFKDNYMSCKSINQLFTLEPGFEFRTVLFMSILEKVWESYYQWFIPGKST